MTSLESCGSQLSELLRPANSRLNSTQQVVLAAAQGRMAAAGVWMLNESALSSTPSWATYKYDWAVRDAVWIDE
jgi:hypothetical protein